MGLIADGVSFTFEQNKNVLSDISFKMRDNDIVAIVGTSGCGKSTFLKILCGILPQSKHHAFVGDIRIDGMSPKEYSKLGKTGFMFQDPTLLPNLTVRENIALPLKITNGDVDEKAVTDLIEMIALSNYEGYLPGQLSGGMKTRVALARTFITKPSFILLDEPMTALVNPSTFRLGSFGFGNYVFTVPPNRSIYSERLDVIDGLGIYVDVLAGVDFNERQAFWIFKSVDPATGLAPDDAFTGFLPVNDTTINFYNDTIPKPGEGFVNYSIRSADDVVTGDSISAQAGIVFDLNAPVITNNWVNVVDAFPPMSSIEPIPQSVSSNMIELTFVAEDDSGGSGLRDIDLYVSRDGAPFYLHEEGIDSTKYTFAGLDGGEYCFFTLATDNVENTEAMKTESTICTMLESRQVFNLSVFLEGAHDSIGSMTTTLNTSRHILPGQTPVSNLTTPTPAGQPYNRPPWNYEGTEGIDWTDADYPAEAVDWVLVSFRTNIQKSTQIGMTAALLLQDGKVEIPATFALPDGTDSTYVVVEHRNHIGVMTPQAINVVNDTLTYNFTLTDSYDGNGTGSGQKQMSTGEWAMFAGDADQSDLPSYDILGSDKILWEIQNGDFDYYSTPDFNLNGDVNGEDKVLWFDNNGISSRVPKE